MDTTPKLEKLRGIIKETGGVLVAYSGGVDSSVVLAIAAEQLGERVLAVTAVSPVYPGRELDVARQTAARLGVRHIELALDHVNEIPGFAENPPERCYICKSHIFGKLSEMARQEGLVLCHGDHAGDVSDDRPGHKAALEAGARAPLAEAGLVKPEIRQIAHDLGLPAADLPSLACLATRFPYGSRLTDEEIVKVGRAEEFLAGLGFANGRARHHGPVLRIEVPEDQMATLLDPEVRVKIDEFMRELGFKHVAVDLRGYRMGGAN